MKNITKYGVSALCGSLATVSAVNAGELSVSGGADLTWISHENTTVGNPLGMGSNMTFSGSGELDNGWTYALSIAHTNKAAYSAANLKITTNGLGSVTINGGNGGAGIDAYDDKMPTAWEEVWGTSVGTGVDLVSGLGGSMAMEWASPTVLGTSLAVAYAHKNDGVEPNDKAGSGETGGTKEAVMDARININPSLGTDVLSGLNIFAGGSRSDQNHIAAAGGKTWGDHEEVTAGLTYALGPVTLGLQKSGEFTGTQGTETSTEYYSNMMYGVSFNVNDNLSLSYGRLESKRGFDGEFHSPKLVADSIQAAYTMGGLSLRWAHTEVDHAKYNSASANSGAEGYTISMGLAF